MIREACLRATFGAISASPRGTLVQVSVPL